jgi:hypothetical protein
MCINKKQERDEALKRRVEPVAGDLPLLMNEPGKFDELALEILLDRLWNTRYSYRVMGPKVRYSDNLDTFDQQTAVRALDEDFKGKSPWMKVYEKSTSPVSLDQLQSFLPKPEPDEEAKQEPEITPRDDVQPVDLHIESDKFTTLKDLLILLRDKDIPELEQQLDLVEADPEFFSFVRDWLLKAMRRFKLEMYLPDALVARLTGRPTSSS